MASTLLAAREGPFYDPYEALGPAAREDLQRARLGALLDHATKNSEFYRARLGDLKLDARNANPLAGVPALVSADLRAGVPPVGSSLVTNLDQGCSVFQSGGTTGVPKTSLFTHEELELINLCNARGFYATGLRAEDRVANLWAVGGLYMTFVHMNRVLQQYGCMSFPFSNQTPVDFVHTIAKLFDINCFTGITSVVLNALREIAKKDPGALKVEKVYFGGEHIYEADRRELAESFGVKAVRAPGYGTIDSWYLGYQCDHTTNGIFHAFDDMVYLEILDEETMLPVARGEKGMLFATALLRKLTPIVRFRVGDLARWVPNACACGRTTPLFELLGRGDDVLRIGYDSVDYATVQKIVVGVPGASGRIQMEKRREEGRDRLIFRIETDREVGEHAAMTEKLLEIFLAERPSFREFVKKGTIWPLVVEWKKDGELPQNSRTGKLIRVIDAL